MLREMAAPPPFPGSDAFLDRIFPAELQEIRRRRVNLSLPQEMLAEGDLPNPDVPVKALPSTELGLVGLALSGGGIRSAAFNLGVIQSLIGNRVLQKIDYVSTVSGGGYIGSCLALAMSQKHVHPTPAKMPLHFDSKHGRQKRLRGTTGYSEPPALRHLRDGARYITPGGSKDLAVIPFLLLRGIAINLVALLAYAGAVTGFAMLALRGIYELVPADRREWDFGLWVAVISILFFGFLLGTLVLEFQRRLRGRGRERVRVWIAYLLIGAAGIVLLASQPWVFTWFWRTLRHGEAIALPAWLTGAGIVGVLLQAASIVRNPPAWARYALLIVLGVIGPALVYSFVIAYAGWLWFDVDPPSSALWPAPPADGFMGRFGWSFFGIGLVGSFILGTLDINRSSMFFFYRDRLSRLFLFRTTRDDNYVDQNGCDDLKLSDLSPPDAVAPYLLINAAVNLQGSKDTSLRGRNADFFLFSKHFVGSRRTGYCATKALEAEDPDLDVATAVAISAAAAAPNMGASTVRALVFVMTLLNVRLGYWLPNPGAIDGGARSPTGRKRWTYNVGITLLARELFSLLHEKSNIVNVTDGGHVENLGILELLRRRCKVIIASDAEADEQIQFPSLARIVRFARTDLGIDIDLDVDRIRIPGNDSHFAVGAIHYPGGEEGHLIYLKSSIVGTENLYVRHERAVDPHFPHTPTSNQFFTESQFECYRSLGFHVANRAFRNWDAQARISPAWARDLRAT